VNTALDSKSCVEFAVSSVPEATEALPEVAYKEAVEHLLAPLAAQLRDLPEEVQERYPLRMREWRIEACSHYHGRLLANIECHPVLAAVHFAFACHRPLVLSPDVIWLLIAQGFAHHVTAHAEELRAKLVEHTGKLKIVVRRDDFLKGSPENTWPDVFAEFSGQIRKHLGAATHDLLLPSFTTTGPVERAACEVVLLDAMKSYFEYELHSMCGIPRIVLEGTTDDWIKLAERAQGLGRFDLLWWTKLLAPILDQFVASSRGKVNLPFWKSIFKFDDSSGGPYITGWINAFFPYLKNREAGLVTQRNPWLFNGDSKIKRLLFPRPWRIARGHPDGPTTEHFPIGMSKVPFRWMFGRESDGDSSEPIVDRSFDMEFLGGFVGVRQEAGALRLKPEIGWAVRNAQTKGTSPGAPTLP
jgi:hypothetical protein